jgi:pantoate--beta-alanine ligase
LSVEVLSELARWRAALDAYRSRGRSVGLVPTMGALHAGHLSLVRRAAAECDVVAVSDYVNPLQFGPAEDLSAYPRDLDRDCELLAEAGAHLVLAPEPKDMWPVPPLVSVHVAGLTERLEGASRPGHFNGVATIVAKLLSLTGPSRAYFGEKDYQQLTIVRRLVGDLSLPVEVVGCPTIRHPDGLALSSRNAYLTPEQRRVAPALYHSLLAGKRAVEADGATDPGTVEAVMAAVVAAEPQLELIYAEAVDPDDLSRPEALVGPVRLLVAARLGRARLIDNLAAQRPEPVGQPGPGVAEAGVEG